VCDLIRRDPDAAAEQSHNRARACDLFLAIASSLKIDPAAGLPALAKQAGADLVIVNREQTDLDLLADLVINGEDRAGSGDYSQSVMAKRPVRLARKCSRSSVRF
jgi:NAD-dependent SIR2 family protein deacetylase